MFREQALVVACILCGALIVSGKDDDCTDEYQVKHLTLSLTYGPGFCSQNHCQGPYQDFSIHGLWPNTAPDVKNCCSKEKNVIEKIQPLTTKLKKFWSNLRGQDFWLWQHEWDKHGKCASKVANIHTPILYFQFALDQFKNLKILSRLKGAGFSPSNKKSYRGKDIEESLQAAYGHRAVIICKPFSNKMVLTEIRLCYSTNLKMRDCSPQTHSKCLEELYLLSE